MTTTDTSTTRVTAESAGPVGARLAAGAVLFASGVALEWVLDPQRGDGVVEHAARFAICVGTSAVGAALMTWSLRALRPTLPGTRSVRFGRATAEVGTALIGLATVAILVTGLVSGEPAGIAFIPWAIGILALAIGPVALGIGLLRHRRDVGAGAMLAGVAAFGSLAIPIDPWHDVSLMATCAAWAAVGLAVRR